MTCRAVLQVFNLYTVHQHYTIHFIKRLNVTSYNLNKLYIFQFLWDVQNRILGVGLHLFFNGLVHNKRKVAQFLDICLLLTNLLLNINPGDS